jgi:hypothetical protein
MEKEKPELAVGYKTHHLSDKLKHFEKTGKYIAKFE